MGHQFVAVAAIEMEIYAIISQVTRVGGCDSEVAALLSDHCKEVMKQMLGPATHNLPELKGKH